MAQVARSLPPADSRLAPPPRLRAVPPLRATRGPSPGAIRRRRALALGGLAILVALPLAALALRGPSPASAGQIATLLRRGAADPATLCDHLSPRMLVAAGGHAACIRASPARGPVASVDAIRVSGDAATAVVHRPDGDERVRLVRVAGAWRVDDVR